MSWDSPNVVVAGIVGLLSVAMAVCSVVFSTRANARASAANEKALELQKRYAPPTWGPVEGDGIKLRVENRSGRAINVLQMTAHPADSAGAVTFRSPPGSLIDYGDALHFLIDSSITQNPQEIEIAWVYADDTSMEREYLRRRIPPR